MKIMRTVSLMVKLLVMCCVFAGCGKPEVNSDASEAATAVGAENNLADQLVQIKQTLSPSYVLSGYPDMDRDIAYKIQLEAFRSESEDGNYLVGWKMGGSRVVDKSVPPDPSFAYMLLSDSLPDGANVSGAKYVNGDLLVEAEIAFIMGSDLKGDGHTMEAVMEAVAEVAGAIELIDIRIVPGADGVPPSMNHNIAAQLSHAGFILTEQRHALEGFDLTGETARVLVDGVEQAYGNGSQIMGTTPLDAIHWIANALPKQGHYLRAGDVVITGSLYDNPTLVAGSTAHVEFTSFGAISVSMGE